MIIYDISVVKTKVPVDSSFCNVVLYMGHDPAVMVGGIRKSIVMGGAVWLRLGDKLDSMKHRVFRRTHHKYRIKTILNTV